MFLYCEMDGDGMKLWMHQVEVFVDFIIPWCVLVLLFLVVMEIFFYAAVEPYSSSFHVIDFIILLVFWVDLVFKYIRVKNVPKFIHLYFMDIIAVFPFFLVFRLFESIAFVISDSVRSGQVLFHEGLEMERIGVKFVKHVSHGNTLQRSYLFFRFARPLLRIPRLLKIIPYFERPTGHHHKHEFLHFPYSSAR